MRAHFGLTLLLAGSMLAGALPPALANAESMTLLRSTEPEAILSRADAVVYLYRAFAPERLRRELPASQATFLDVSTSSPLLPMLQSLCVAEALTCTGGDFLPDQPVSMPAILKMYDALLHAHTDTAVPTLPAEKRTGKTWNTAYMQWGEELGLIPAGSLMTPVTTKDLQYVLDRHSYLRSWHFTLPHAKDQLPATLDDITEDRYPTLELVRAAREKITTVRTSIQERGKTRTSLLHRQEDTVVIGRLLALDVGLRHLETFMLEHPLYYDGSFSAEERREFRELGLPEIIGVGEYDFRTNPGYRKHNIRVTLKHIHKMVLQPGEEFDYWKLMYAKGMEDVVNGWLIVEGKEVWGWGGGLCGTATAIFRGAWFSGLEITERRPHTNYYFGLYGRDMGLDATVYQNSPNLRFKNNTGHPVMLYLRYNDTQDDAKVMVLGTKHFTHFDFVKGARRGKAISHKRVLTMKDGTVWEDPLFSAYRKLE